MQSIDNFECPHVREHSEPCPKCSASIAVMPFNQLAAECHADNQHWWHHPATGEKLVRNPDELIMLMVSEVAEAMEGERKNLMDDHLPGRRMAEVELADVIIRIMDYAGAYNLDLDTTIVGLWLPVRPNNKGAALLQIVHELTMAAQRHGSIHWETWRICRAILLVQRYAYAYGYDLDGAVADKRAYNAVRADHKPAARLAQNGKTF